MTKAYSCINTLFTDRQIKQRVLELGAQITKDYLGKDLVVIGLLYGAYAFCADLIRAVDANVNLSFMRVSSYGDNLASSGEVKILYDLDRSIENCHVLLVEDIVDTGLTLLNVGKLLQKRNPASIKVATLLDKPCKRRVDVSIDYVGFSIEDYFVVGYGLDLDGKYRNLPYVGIYNIE